MEPICGELQILRFDGNLAILMNDVSGDMQGFTVGSIRTAEIEVK